MASVTSASPTGQVDCYPCEHSRAEQWKKVGGSWLPPSYQRTMAISHEVTLGFVIVEAGYGVLNWLV